MPTRKDDKSTARGRHGSRSTSAYPRLPSTTCSRPRNSASRQSATTCVKWQRSNTNLLSTSSYLRMGESLFEQKQWYDLTRTRNQTASVLEFDLGDVRRHRYHHSSAGAAVPGTGQDLADDLVHHDDNNNVFTTWGKCFPPKVSQRFHCFDRPPTNKSRLGGERTVKLRKLVSVKCITVR